LVTGSVLFYRAVDESEWDSLLKIRRFICPEGGNEGKYVAVSRTEAKQWGRLLHPGRPIRIVPVRFPVRLLGSLSHSTPNLDRIGIAWMVPLPLVPTLKPILWRASLCEPE